jgi:hypothetical protein
VAALAVVLSVAPVAAQAAPPRPTAVTVAGKGVSGKLTITQQERPEVFQALLNEVSWLANATPQTSKPNADKLGPRYVVTVLIKNAPQQVYELYPLAAGGPRAHRPAKQPTGKKADGWFYGRLSMSESLRVSGVPLETRSRTVNGGIGGGIGEEVTVDEAAPVLGVEDLLTQMRQLVLLNGAVLVVILLGLAGIAFLIRRRV